MNKNSLSLTERLLNNLSAKKLLSESGIKKAAEIQKAKGGKLSDILVDAGIVSRRDLVSALSEELNIPAIDLGRYKVSQDAINLIPLKIAKKYNILPLSKTGDVLTIAATDPFNVFAIDDIAALTGLKISMVIASSRDIGALISEYYEGGTHEAIEKIIGEIGPKTDLDVLSEGGEDVSTLRLSQLIKDEPVVKIADMLVSEAVSVRASDILIEPLEDVLRVRYRIDGVLKEFNKFPKKIHLALISRLKIMSNLDIAEMRRPQDGHFKAKIQGREIDFRISCVPSSNGEKIALRILDKMQATLDIDKLGFEEGPLNDIKNAAKRPHGMILSCGPTGCGKTTTLYSIIKLIDSPDKNIITAEDPVEYQLPGINQVTIKPELGLTFASSLRSFLRQDPDIIMVGEIRDFETADVSIKAALTGHLVLSTLHTTTASGSIIRLINMGVEPFLITSSVVLVIAERLVRKICDSCREEYKLDSAAADMLQLKPGGKNTAYRGKGCEVCKGAGYRGRVGLAETLMLTPKIRGLILAGAEEHKLRDEARREGLKSLRENGVEKIIKGITTVTEVLRVTVGEQEVNL